MTFHPFLAEKIGEFLAPTLASLTFREPERSPSRGEIAVTLALHLAGLAAVWRYFQQPVWLAIPTLAALLALPILVSLRTRRALAVETLAPLFFLYVILLARVIAIWFVRAPLPYQDESTLANVRLLVFQIELAVVAALAYTALVQIARFTRYATRLFELLALGIVIASLVWFAAETFTHRTHGVTGTDPYAYVQMAVDLAERGTLLHSFPLFNEIKDLGIKWYPIQHIGYRLFENETGLAATVWPPGGSLWLALTHRLIGEAGLYVATPIAALLSLIAFAFFAHNYFRERDSLERWVVAAIAVALLATSWEQVDRSLVPLVDVQAQLFSILVIGFSLRGIRGNVGRWGVLAGLSLGAAYLIRHTQVLLVVPIIVAAWQLSMRERVKFLASVAISSFILALPDLIYHQQNFGSWFTPESNELALFGFTSIVSSAQIIVDRFFAGNEFGYLFPFFFYGAYRAARENAGKFAVLASWLLVLVGFHLLYAALRVRDLLPEFPVVALFTAYGIVALVRELRLDVIARRGFSAEATLAPHASAGVSRSALKDCFASLAITMRQILAATTIFLAFLLFLTRTQYTLMRVIQPAKVTFGYVTATQRASFDQIGALTPQNAVIGSTMNDGAIDLYTHRATFRPGDWKSVECAKFVDAMFRASRRVFLLDDGAETSDARRDLVLQYKLNQMAVLDVPVFGVVDGTPGVLWEILKTDDR